MSWEAILGVITHPMVIAVVMAIAGVAIKGFVHYKKAFSEAIDVPRSILKARGKDSPGGKTITRDEYATIGREIVELASEAGRLYTARKNRIQ